jgi:hypothetical protein
MTCRSYTGLLAAGEAKDGPEVHVVSFNVPLGPCAAPGCGQRSPPAHWGEAALVLADQAPGAHSTLVILCLFQLRALGAYNYLASGLAVQHIL